MALYVLEWEQLVVDSECTSGEGIEVAFNFGPKHNHITVAQFPRFMLSELRVVDKRAVHRTNISNVNLEPS